MAQRFAFRLDVVLRVRALREEQARRAVAGKQAEIVRLDRLDRLTQEEIRRQQSALRGEQERARLDPLEVGRVRAWIAHLRRLVHERRGLRAQKQSQLAQLQEALRQARIERRMLEKLRERRWNEHERDRRVREQAGADEAARELHRRASMDEARGPRPAAPADAEAPWA